MLRHAIVNQDGKVVNVIVWDGVTEWKPPANHIAVRSDKCDIGDLYDPNAKAFAKPVVKKD